MCLCVCACALMEAGGQTGVPLSGTTHLFIDTGCLSCLKVTKSGQKTSDPHALVFASSLFTFQACATVIGCVCRNTFPHYLDYTIKNKAAAAIAERHTAVRKKVERHGVSIRSGYKKGIMSAARGKSHHQTATDRPSESYRLRSKSEFPPRLTLTVLST